MQVLAGFQCRSHVQEYGENNKIVKIVLMLLLCLCKTQFILAYCIGLCIGTVYDFYKQQPFVPSFLNVDTHPYEKIEVWDRPPAVPYSYISVMVIWKRDSKLASY